MSPRPPDWRRAFRFGRADVPRDVDRELRFHLEMAERDNLAAGMPPEQARAEAIRRFGDVARVRGTLEDMGRRREREARAADLLDDLRRDAGYALRQLGRSRGFTAAAVITLALGIGANGLMFGFADALLLRPLPGIREPARLIEVSRPSMSYPSYRDFREANPTLAGLAAFSDRSMSISDGEHTDLSEVGVVSGNYFSVLGVGTTRGRTLGDADDAPGAPPAAVISADFAKRFFGAGADPMGRVIKLNGFATTIVGVAPEHFRGTRLVGTRALWISIHTWMEMAPSSFAGLSLERRGWSWLTMVGRLRPGATLEQGTADLNTAAKRQEAEYPGPTPKNFRMEQVNTGEHAAVPGDARDMVVRFVAVLIGVVAIVLLIACANVANLLLSRAAGRRREIGVRVALGAGRGRLIRQLITESVVLALLAAVVGLVATQLATRALAGVSLAGGWLSFATLDLHVDARVAAYTGAVALAASIIFGLAPALQSTPRDLVASLKDGAPGSGRGRSRLRRALLVAQVALSLTLLIGAGLFTRSLTRALRADVGFDGDRVAAASVDVGLVRYDSSRAGQYYDAVIRELSAAPGLRYAAWGSVLPLDPGYDAESFTVEGYVPAKDEKLQVQEAAVSAGYLEAFSVPLVRGRLFTGRDDASTPHVIVINESMAKRYWPEGDAIGRRVVFSGDTTSVIGIVRDIHYHDLREQPAPFAYRLLAQNLRYAGLQPMSLVVRTSGDPAAALGTLRTVLRRTSVDVPVYDLGTFHERTGHVVLTQQLGAVVLGLFGALALVIAAVGVYSVAAYAASQRTREIGIRMALGARSGAVLRLVLAENMVALGLGLAIGLALSAALAPAMSSFLFGVTATDVPTYAGVALALLAIGVGAALVPAWRATRLDPVTALHAE